MIPYTELTLQGKTYNLRFGLREMCLFERETGKKIQELEQNIGMETTAQMLHQMLKREIPEIKLEDVWDMVDETASDILGITDIIGTAIKAVSDSVGESPNAQTPTTKRTFSPFKKNTR